MRKIIVCAAVWTAISVTGAQAAQALGQGSASCGKWTENQRDKFFAVVDGVWLSGYLSGYSVYTSDEIDLHLPDQAAREGWMTDYCKNHPLDQIYKAADQLILELIKRQSSQR
jgi:hypothetical protein